MVRKALFAGIYTNYKQTLACFKDCSWNFLITKPILEDTERNTNQGKLGVLQFVAQSISTAYEGEIPESDGQGTDDFLIPCPGSHRGNPCQGHQKLQEAYSAEKDVKKENHEILEVSHQMAPFC